jgi:hypothetical protein
MDHWRIALGGSTILETRIELANIWPMLVHTSSSTIVHTSTKNSTSGLFLMDPYRA